MAGVSIAENEIKSAKPWVLITGASGGIGEHLEQNLRKNYSILRVSRKEQDDLPSDVSAVKLDLTKESAFEAIPTDRKIEWIVHLATSYTVKKDNLMLSNLMKLARERNIPNFCFFSSWVVSFPKRLVREPYLRMKAECEKRLRAFCHETKKHFLIIRPSVVTGEGLSWSRVLNRLWYVRYLIPRNMYRCWIPVEHITAAVEGHFKAVRKGDAKSKVMQLLGERETLFQATHTRTLHSPHWQPFPDEISVLLLWLIAPLCFAIRMLVYVIMAIISWFSTYLNSFYIQHFTPESQEELLSFFNRYNNCLISGSENMLLWHYTPPWIIAEKKILVTTRRLNKIHKLDKSVVVCDSGVTIAELLKALTRKNLSISTYPNYHDITLGACVAGPVHGHSHQFATVAALISCIKVFDVAEQQIKYIHKGTPEFRDLVFNTTNNILVLEVNLIPCPLEEFVKTRKRFDFVSTSPEVLIKHAKFGDSCEVRMYVPILDYCLGASKYIRSLPILGGLMLTATVWSRRNNASKMSVKEEKVMEEKEENVKQEDNRKGGEIEKVKGDINWKRYVEYSTKFLWSLGSKCIMNTEWFFTEEEFIVFWKFYQKNWNRLGFYKILIRHCKADDFPHSPCFQRNVYAIDIIALRYQRNTLANIMPRFSKTMHAGKFLCTKQNVEKQNV